MLTPEQDLALKKAIYDAMDDDTPARVARDLRKSLASLVDHWLTEALTSGPLPEGWERREEARLPVPPPHGRFTHGAWKNLDGTELDTSSWPRRTVIAGPWEVEG